VPVSRCSSIRRAATTPLQGATVITPNRNELAQVDRRLAQRSAAARAGPALRESLGSTRCCSTRSEDGMSLFDAAGHLQIPAEAREVFDVTGAGDTVIATLAAMIACGLSLREAMPIANRPAASSSASSAPRASATTSCWHEGCRMAERFSSCITPRRAPRNLHSSRHLSESRRPERPA
jgi:sugar/nucleoside kinase (ribokinase family)